MSAIQNDIDRRDWAAIVKSSYAPLSEERIAACHAEIEAKRVEWAPGALRWQAFRDGTLQAWRMDLYCRYGSDVVSKALHTLAPWC